jgi:hypothetical protein
MSIPVLLGGSTVYLPPDLRKTASDTYKAQSFLNFVTKRIPDLVPGKTYAIQFRWVMQDGTRRQEWSPSYRITIPTDAPKVPTGFTGTSQFASVLVEWDGTYQGSNPTESFNNFKCINVYAGYQNTYSSGTAKLAGILYADLVDNTVTLPVDGTYVQYGQPVYIFASAVNLDGTESSKALVATISGGATRASDVDLGPGAVTISKLKGDVLVFDNIKGGTISATSFLRAGNATGARIELSSSTTNITSYPDPITGLPTPLTYVITPGMAVYNTANQKVFSADLSGNITLTGQVTATSGYIGNPSYGAWSILSTDDNNGGITEISSSDGSLVLTSTNSTIVPVPQIKLNDYRIYAALGPMHIVDQGYYGTSLDPVNVLKTNSTSEIVIGGKQSSGFSALYPIAGASYTTNSGGARMLRNMLTVSTSNYNSASSYSSSDGDVLLVYTP